MKRIAVLIAPLALLACTGTATVQVALTHEIGAPGAVSAPGDLSGVAAVNVTVVGIDVHLSGEKAPDTVDGGSVPDHDGGWHEVAGIDPAGIPVDLMAIATPEDALALGAALEVPAPSKVTQMRLRLATAGPHPGDAGYDVIPGAVLLADQVTRLDLVVPHSAFDPGVKIEGLFKAARLEPGDEVTVIVDLQLREILDGTAYRLNPVLKVRRVDHKP